jgi:hypothetical protein
MNPRALATVDAHRAFFFLCRSTPRSQWRIEPGDEFHNAWDQRTQHARPTVLGRGPSASAAQHFADRKHEVEELDRRFARAVAGWLARCAGEVPVDRLVLFAAPKFIARLRPELSNLPIPFDLHEAQLTHLHADQLARHPAVLESLGAPPRTTPHQGAGHMIPAVGIATVPGRRRRP